MHAISGYHGNRPTNKHTNRQGDYNTLRRSLVRSVNRPIPIDIAGLYDILDQTTQPHTVPVPAARKSRYSIQPSTRLYIRKTHHLGQKWNTQRTVANS